MRHPRPLPVMPRAAWIWCALCVMTSAAWAGEDDDDAAALALGGVTPASAATTARSTSLLLEGAVAAAAQQGADELYVGRLSADARYDGSFAQGWRAIIAERIDSDWTLAGANQGLGGGSQATGTGNQTVGTLKEAYLGWQPTANLLVDAGRINARQGVAYGYNPTDFFRADAIRSLVSPDPNSLRDNRLGTVMLRAEDLWSTGAVTAAYAPRLTDHTSSAALDPDWGATNSTGRWLLVFSQRLSPGWTPQWLIYGRDSQAPQVGVDLTAGLGSSTIAYIEASAGRSASLLAQALDQPGEDKLRTRVSTGVTYSTAKKLSLTFEYEYNGAGLSSGAWSRLGTGNPQAYGRYREFALLQQDLPTLSNAFVYASWADVGFRHLDLTAFLRVDLVDHSKLPYIELRRHWTSVDLALRWQDVQGNSVSDFGASTQRQTWQLVLDYYL